MFPWSAVFSLGTKIPGQRSPQEMVTNTLMLELGALMKRTERLRHQRAAEMRRRSSSVDYTWLAGPPPKLACELTPGELLELQELCSRLPPSQCGPIILKLRKLVMEFEPEVQEVPRLFRSMLQDCLDEEEGDIPDEPPGVRAGLWQKQRSNSLCFDTFRSKLRLNPFRGRSQGGSRNNLEGSWSEEEEEEEEGPVELVGGVKRQRSRSLPEITPFEQTAQS